MADALFPGEIYNVNIVSEKVLPSPQEVKEKIPLTSSAVSTVVKMRNTLQDILARKDPRLFIVVGPCSIHDLKAAHEYAVKLRDLAEKIQDTFVVVMRVYFEKPRSVVGWKGFINDPHLDNSFCIEEGLHKARKLLLDLAELGLGAGTEALDPVTPQYIHDLISWTAIGARTTESQTHREIASGLSSPVGFKNGTDGNIDVAINALKAVSKPQHFLGINRDGQCTVMQTRGNRFAHVVLRGGSRPNYDSVSVSLCESALKKEGLAPNIAIDCSHGNTMKDASLQPLVLNNCVNQIVEGNASILSLMLESNLFAGKQTIGDDPKSLAYGVSVTDECIGWDTTEEILLKAHEKLKPIVQNPAARRLR